MKEAVADMKLDRKCKNSVLYKASNPESADIITGLYLMNKGFNALEAPENIVVSIRQMAKT